MLGEKYFAFWDFHFEVKTKFAWFLYIYQMSHSFPGTDEQIHVYKLSINSVKLHNVIE